MRKAILLYSLLGSKKLHVNKQPAYLNYHLTSTKTNVTSI